MIGRKTHLARSNQICYYLKLPSLGDFVQAKELSYQFTLPEILMIKNLHYNWTRGAIEERQKLLHPTKSSTRSCLLDNYLHAKDLRYRLISSRDNDGQKMLQSYWLDLGHNWKIRFFSDPSFCRIIKNTIMHYFLGKNRHINGFGVSQKPRNHILVFFPI